MNVEDGCQTLEDSLSHLLTEVLRVRRSADRLLETGESEEAFGLDGGARDEFARLAEEFAENLDEVSDRLVKVGRVATVMRGCAVPPVAG